MKKNKLADRATVFVICFSMVYFPTKVLVHYQVIEGSTETWAIAIILGVCLYLLGR